MRTTFALCALIATVLSACDDGVNNVVTVGDVNDPSLDIHFENVKAQTYDENMKPACQGKDAEVRFPGYLKLVSGDVKVAAAHNLAASGDGELNLKKNSFLIGTICENGKSKNALIPDKDCTISVCALLGSDICTMLSTPGTYDLAEVEKALNVSTTITLPTISGVINGILKGEWQAGLNLVSNGKTVGDIKLPGNEQYVYIS